MARSVSGRLAISLGAALAVACGGDQGPEVDPLVAPFVGTWDADSLTVRNLATSDTANVLEFGSFFITVQPSGQYTATLTVYRQANPEIGQLGVISGSTLSLTPTFPAGRPVATATYSFVAADRLIMDGATEFDFNLDGTPEDAQAHFELQRQGP
jgi:hypothetical protein